MIQLVTYIHLDHHHSHLSLFFMYARDMELVYLIQAIHHVLTTSSSHSGSTTRGTLHYTGQLSQPICTDPRTTTPNVCSTQPHRSADGNNVLGVTVFVWTDCATNQVLPDVVQDPAYRYQDVKMPQLQVAKALGAKEEKQPQPGSCGAPFC